MKTIRFFLAAIMMMVAFTLQAQERVVQVYKNGQVIKEYAASEVKSVEVNQVLTYKYYIGNNADEEWEPTSFEGLTTQTATSKDDFIGVTHVTNGEYIYIIIPSEWINNKTTGLATINMMKNSAGFIVALYKDVITTFTDNGIKYSVLSSNSKIATDTITIQNF